MAKILKFDAQDYATRGNAILGIRDSGKTYTATGIAERLYDAGVPFIAFDPIGVWRFLRVPGKGKGRPIVVAGGAEADLPLTPATAPQIVRAAMKNGVSLVIDLFDINLSKADWRKIVKDSVRVLIHENRPHGLRHVFIEEAAEFAPQTVRDGDVYAEMEKLARMGGNSRLGYTLINQRAEEVNKALLELCDNLFLHRQKGKNSLLSLRKWLDAGDVADAKQIVDSLATLPQGVCWTWMAGESHATLTKVPVKDSLHPDRRTMRGDDTVPADKKVDVDKFVGGMREQLAAIEEQAKENDPKLLRQEIATLKRTLDQANRSAPDPAAEQNAYNRGLAVGLTKAKNRQNVIHSAATRAQDAIQNILMSLDDWNEIEKTIAETASTHFIRRDAPPVPISASPPRKIVNGSAHLPPGELAVLTAAAQFGTVEREQLTILTGYKRSSRDAYIQRLREKGFISVEGSTVTPTAAGHAALPANYEPLPTGADLRAYWLNRLPEGERRVLEILVTAYPRAVARENIDQGTGYKRSSRDAYLQRMKAKLLWEPADGGVRASPSLF